jgi:GNAT superfamily N-acetyltransferase
MPNRLSQSLASHFSNLLGPFGGRSMRQDSADVVSLFDGRKVIITPVRPQDCAAERAFVGGLSQTSRYRRFHFGLRELSPEASRAMTNVDQHHHVAFVAHPVAADRRDDESIVADARYVVRADGGEAEAEFAIAVADEWQGAGLGRELLVRMTAHARAQGLRRLFGDVLWGNTSMIALVRSIGGQLKRSSGDSTIVRAEFRIGEEVSATA